MRTSARWLGAGLAIMAVVTGVGAGVATPPLASAPSHSQDTPVSTQDRVYVADQTSNTVSVIDPDANKTLGTIALGAQRLGPTFSPQHLADIGVHGLAGSRDSKRLAVVSVTSNTVDIVDTTTNKVLNHTDVGRAAHEGTFTADGREFWVADRGRDTVTVVDAVHGGVLTKIRVGSGPSKVVLSPDGKRAYVNHISMPEITVVDVRSRRVSGHITGLGDAFSSDQAISPDGKELWAAHKRVGKISVVDLVHRKVTAVLETGPDTNHPQFADNRDGHFVYLTIGGLDQVAVYRRTSDGPVPVTRIHTTGRAPHGLWPSADGSKVYVGLEKSDAVDVIDTLTNTVTATIPIGQEPQALVYVPKVPNAGDAPNLTRQGLDQQARAVPTTLPDGTAGDTMDPVLGRRLEATIRPVSGMDMIQLQARGLAPNTTYRTFTTGDDGKRPIVDFTTDAGGNAPQVLAFTIFTGTSVAVEQAPAGTPAVMPMAGACDCCC